MVRWPTDAVVQVEPDAPSKCSDMQLVGAGAGEGSTPPARYEDAAWVGAGANEASNAAPRVADLGDLPSLIANGEAVASRGGAVATCIVCPACLTSALAAPWESLAV